MMYRQGDLLIVRNTSPDMRRRNPVTDGLVERGEATGHAHRLVGGEVYNGGSLLVSEGSAQLVHEEHDTITLPEGEYRVLRQREFMSEGEWSTVHD